MTQERIAGILLMLIGMFLLVKPMAAWKITERWKNKDVSNLLKKSL